MEISIIRLSSKEKTSGDSTSKNSQMELSLKGSISGVGIAKISVFSTI